MTKLIAEIGWNHMGDMSLAEEMIQSASSSGASIAKFQSWNYQRLKPGPWDHDGRREIYEKAVLTPEKHQTLLTLCNKYNIEFMSSAFSLEDAKYLKSIGCHKIKIPSFEVANLSLLSYAAENFMHIFISTGTATFDEVKSAISLLSGSSFTLFHCVSTYPCLPSSINLSRLNYFKHLHSDIGFSDHTQGVEVSKIAVTMRASYIEKHFTVDHALPGRDNKFAILPADLQDLSTFISIYNDSMIPHGLNFQESELETRNLYRGRFAA